MNSKWQENREIIENRLSRTNKKTIKNIIIKRITNYIKSSSIFKRIYKKAIKKSQEIELTNIYIKKENLPIDFDGFRIVHLTDLHLDSSEGICDRICEKITDIKCDVVFFTGDYASGTIPSEKISEDISKIKKHINPKFGFFGTLGNNDKAKLSNHLENVGINMLNNKSHQITIGKSHINIVGLDDTNKFFTEDITKTIDEIDVAEFNILITHTPETTDYTREIPDIYITGHTHGSQVNIPGLMTLYKPLGKTSGKDLMQGIWTRGRTTGFTSRGIGISILPIRFRCPSEISTITLKT